MISIIVCSRNKVLPSEFTSSLNQTIGLQYEYVIVDNTTNKYSIFQAYDLGVQQAKGDILVFVHDDVVFLSENWGNSLYEIFSDSTVGLVGVVGTHFLPQTPSSWWDPELSVGQIVQGRYNEGRYQASFEKYTLRRKTSSSVVAVDGVFLAMRKSSFDLLSWDMKKYQGFHCYDLDISMQVLKNGMKVIIADDIVLEHKSLGSLNESLFRSQETFVKKWEDFLPVYRGIEMTDGEVQARTRIVQLKRRTDRFSRFIKSIHDSRVYRLYRGICNWINK